MLIFSDTKGPSITIIGAGVAGGKLHRNIYENLGFKNIAFVDLDSSKIEKLKKEGKLAFSNFEDAAERIGNSEIIDICVPTKYHLETLKKIANIHPKKLRIILEKPACSYEDISELKELVSKYPDMKICVQENYRSSETIDKLAEIAKKNFKKITNIWSEFTKTCKDDFANGRCIEPHGVLYYEFPHILTIYDKFCEILGMSGKVINHSTTFTPLNMSGIDETSYKHGGGKVSFQTDESVDVTLCSSMAGEILIPLLPYATKDSKPIIDPKRRYRMFAVKGEYHDNKKGTLVAFLDKVDDLDTLESVIYFIDEKNGPERIVDRFEDNTLKKNLIKCTEYLLDDKDSIENPSPLHEAIEIVKKIAQFNQ